MKMDRVHTFNIALQDHNIYAKKQKSRGRRFEGFRGRREREFRGKMLPTVE